MPHSFVSGLPCLLGTRRTSTGLEICDLLLGQGWHHSCSRLLHSPPLHWARALSLDDRRSSGKSFSEMPSLSHLNLSHFSGAFPNARSICPNLAGQRTNIFLRPGNLQRTPGNPQLLQFPLGQSKLLFRDGCSQKSRENTSVERKQVLDPRKGKRDRC